MKVPVKQGDNVVYLDFASASEARKFGGSVIDAANASEPRPDSKPDLVFTDPLPAAITGPVLQIIKRQRDEAREAGLPLYRFPYEAYLDIPAIANAASRIVERHRHKASRSARELADVQYQVYEENGGLSVRTYLRPAA